MHTGLEVGFWEHRICRRYVEITGDPRAGADIARLFELVLTDGTDDGRLLGYTPKDVGMVVAPWTKKPEQIARALLRAGVLARRRRVLYVPDWKRTPTGRYADERREDRLRKRRERKARARAALDAIREGTHAEGASADVRRTSGGQASDVRRSSGASKKGSRPLDADGAPPAPPEGGEGDAQARWAWFLANYPKPFPEKAVRRLLDELPDEQWELVQFAVPYLTALNRWSRTHRKVPNGADFLEKRVYLSAHKPWTDQKAGKESKAKPNGHAAPAAESKRDLAARSVVQELADIDDEGDRNEVKRQWLERWGAPAPWETQ